MPTAPRPRKQGRTYRVSPGGRPLALFGVIFGVALAFLFFPALAGLYLDYGWFDSVGYGSVFTRTLGAKVGVGVAAAALAALVIGVNLLVAFRRSTEFPFLHLGEPQGPRVNLGELAPKLTIPLFGLVVLLFSLAGAAHWDTWLLYQNGGAVGRADPLFGRDVGFYLFQLDGLKAAAIFAQWMVIVGLVGSAGVYFLRGGVVPGPTGVTVRPAARIHLAAIGAVLFLVLAGQAWLKRFTLLYSTTGPVAGASYVDVNVRLPALELLVAAAIVCAVLCVAYGLREQRRLLLVALALYAGVSYGGVQLIPRFVHEYNVLPNEARLEAPFIEHNIQATRFAFGLDAVRVEELEAESDLTRKDIDENRATIENIRLWDHAPLLDTFAEIQEIRTYYDFRSVDNDRYMIDGELRQVMLSPREMNVASLPNRTWITEHFVYTHGYGLTLGPVNRATDQGLPVLLVKDIPPVSETPSVQVSQPGIYFGEMYGGPDDYAFVGTTEKEFDYPAEQDVYGEYKGKAGVPLESLMMRVALAVRTGSVKVLLSTDITDDSRVLLYRHVRSRVDELFPFLGLDEDPYMVVREDGRLAWIQDAYTLSSAYPYSQFYGRHFNYIRNSVKVVVDAYDGSVEAYVSDPDDAIIAAWSRIYPDTFRSMDEIPADIRAHLRYPEYFFGVQTHLLAVYHMDEPAELYNREDEWEFPSVGSPEGPVRMEPYYTVMKLPG
ncbi:MAG: UPF0182 family protein, partial [Myxococcales bacterium]|nr:UPF0182 family protein [Myxococcales bacterium]